MERMLKDIIKELKKLSEEAEISIKLNYPPSETWIIITKKHEKFPLEPLSDNYILVHTIVYEIINKEKMGLIALYGEKLELKDLTKIIKLQKDRYQNWRKPNEYKKKS